MNVLPELNLNKHPRDCKDYSLIDALNMKIAKNSYILQTDNSVIENDKLNYKIKHYVGNNYRIIYAIECNTEIVFIINYNIDTYQLFRYNEDEDKLVPSYKIKYYGGKFTSVFTYNKNDLIIALSEYDENNTINVPLKVFNLKDINYNFTTDEINNSYFKQPICPEVIIPSVTSTIKPGIAYKGWYYIFIRYKIDKNTYTQWFNTNNAVFIDSYIETDYIHYVVSGANVNLDVERPNPNKSYFHKNTVAISSDLDLANASFTYSINNIDTRYKEYQIGFIIVSKSYTKCYRTEDLNINNIKNDYIQEQLVEHYVQDMITSYINYYNVRTVNSYNNVLYIGNYNEQNEDVFNNINLSIDIIKGTRNDTISGLYYLNTEIHKEDYLLPYNYYNFFIHFVDIYGNITKGINISKFNVRPIDDININYIEYDDNILIRVANYSKINLKFNINIHELPVGYVGYTVSYEKVNNFIKYTGVCYCHTTPIRDPAGTGTVVGSTKQLHFISQSLFISDTINLNFDKVVVYKAVAAGNKPVTIKQEDDIKIKMTDWVGEYDVNKREIKYPDVYNNILQNGRLDILLNDDTSKLVQDEIYIAFLINDDYKTTFNKENKELIPCSEISYKNDVIINTNNFFLTEEIALWYKEDVYYNNTTKTYQSASYGRRHDSAENNRSLKTISKPATTFIFECFNNIPFESRSFLNKPVPTFFPMSIATTDDKDKYFDTGVIVELKNVVDLFQNRQPSYSYLHPKILINRNDYNNVYDYPKTIRRSNVIQDESDNLAWRYFNTDNYKNIIENKGEIIKITCIGNIILIHTRHSLFQFNGDSTLQTNNKTIELGNIDIWDLNYKEVFTSKLGFAGINKAEHAIVGQFGYIFYEEDKSRFFRYDNNAIKQIDENINDYVIEQHDKNVYILDDVVNDRLLINFYGTDNYLSTISYNYKFNTFVSLHDSRNTFGYSTKNKVYLTNIKDNRLLYNYTDDYGRYGNNDTAYCTIIVNTNYSLNKVIEYIRYRLNKIDKGIRDNWYSGDILQIFSEECNTGNLNIYVEDARNTANSVKNPNKPYRELGNWNFNFIRANLYSYPVKGTSDNMTRLYGNWFAIKFIFKAFNTNNKCIEIESLDCIVTKSIT